MADDEQHRRGNNRAEVEREPLRKRPALEANPNNSNKKARWEQEEQVRAARLAAQALQPAGKAKDVTNRLRDNRSRKEHAAELVQQAGGDHDIERWQPNEDDRWMPSSSPARAAPTTAGARPVTNSAQPDASRDVQKIRTAPEDEMQPVRSRDQKKSMRKQEKPAKKEKYGDAAGDKPKKKHKEGKGRKSDAVQDRLLDQGQGLSQHDKASTPVDASTKQKSSKQGSKRSSEPAEELEAGLSSRSHRSSERRSLSEQSFEHNRTGTHRSAAKDDDVLNKDGSKRPNEPADELVAGLSSRSHRSTDPSGLPDQKFENQRTETRRISAKDDDARNRRYDNGHREEAAGQRHAAAATRLRQSEPAERASRADYGEAPGSQIRSRGHQPMQYEALPDYPSKGRKELDVSIAEKRPRAESEEDTRPSRHERPEQPSRKQESEKSRDRHVVDRIPRESRGRQSPSPRRQLHDPVPQGRRQDSVPKARPNDEQLDRVDVRSRQRESPTADGTQRRRSSDRGEVGIRARQSEPFADVRRQHSADRDEPMRDRRRQQSPAELRQQSYAREHVEHVEQRRYNGHENRSSRSPERARHRGHGAEPEKRYPDKAAVAVHHRSPESGPSPRRLARGPQPSERRPPVDSSPVRRDQSPMLHASSPSGYRERSPDEAVRLRRADVKADGRFAEAATHSRARSYNEFPPDDYHARASRDFVKHRDEREVREQPEQHRVGPDEYSRQRPLHEQPYPPRPDVERFAGRGKSMGRGGLHGPVGRDDFPPSGMPYPGPRVFSGFPGPRGFTDPRVPPRGMGAPPGFRGPDVALPEDMRVNKGMPCDSHPGPQPKPRKEELPRGRTERPHPDRKDYGDSEASRAQKVPSTPRSLRKTSSGRLEHAATSVPVEDKAVSRGPPRLQLQAQQLFLATAHVSRALAGEVLYRECMAILGKVDQTTSAPNVEVDNTQTLQLGNTDMQPSHEELQVCLDQYNKPLTEGRVVPSLRGFFTVPSQELADYLSSCHASTNLWSTLVVEAAMESTQRAVGSPTAPQLPAIHVNCPPEAVGAAKALRKEVQLLEQNSDDQLGDGRIDNLASAELAASSMPDISHVPAVDEAMEEDAVLYSSEDDDPASGPMEGMSDAEHNQGSDVQQALHHKAQDSLSEHQGTPAEVIEGATEECVAAEQPECERN